MKLDLPALEARAEVHYKKSDEELKGWADYRAKLTDYLELVAENSGEKLLTALALNGNHVERRYLRDAQRERARGDRFTKRAVRMRERYGVTERVLIDPKLGENVLARYEPLRLLEGEVTVDYASDPSDILRGARERLEEPSVKVILQDVVGGKQA